MLDKRISLKKSVAASLIKKVFGIYFIVTIIVTGIQLTVEYFHVKDSITDDIRKMEKTFNNGLAGALWDYNLKQLRSIIFGMNELSTVMGIKIDDDEGSEFGSIGVIISGEEQFFVTSPGQRLTASSDDFTPLKGVFSHSFQIKYIKLSDKSIVNIGTATIYSASGVVIDRIKYGFFLIVVNSVIKTAVLWFIIFFFTRVIIGKPLAVLTEAAEKMDPENPDFFNIRYSSEEKGLLLSEDEMGVLTRSFDKMRKAILERIQNLQIIRDIGEVLATSHEISDSFRLIMKIMGEKYAFRKGSVFLPDDQNIFKTAACYSDAENIVTESGSFSVGEGIVGKAAEKQEIIYISDSYDNPDFTGEASVSESVLCVPLTDENVLSGVMIFSGTDAEFQLTNEIRIFLQAVARLTMINIKNIRMLNIIEDNAKLTQEMEVARRIQTSLLPHSGKNIHPDFDIAATMIPAEEVGGDYYDISLDREGMLWLGIGDVSGHGVTPGLIMMMAQTVHTAITTNFKYSPREVITIINDVLYRNVRDRLGEEHFMTFTALKYHGEGRFEYAGAHLSLIVYRMKDKACERIKTKGAFLNFVEDISPATVNSDFTLDTGDILVLYTDGLTEAKNSKGELLDIRRFMKIIETRAVEDIETLKDSVMNDVLEWCNNKRADDMSLVVVRRRN